MGRNLPIYFYLYILTKDVEFFCIKRRKIMLIQIPNISPEDKFHVSFTEGAVYLKYSNPQELTPETSQIFLRNISKYTHKDFMDLFVLYLEKHPTIYQYNNLRYAVNALMRIEALLGEDITDKQYDINMKREIDPAPLERFKVRYMGNKIIAVISMDEGEKFPTMFYRFRPGSRKPTLLHISEDKKVINPEMVADLDHVMDMQYRTLRNIVEGALEGIREKYLKEKVDIPDDFEIPEELEILFDKNHITGDLIDYMNVYVRILGSMDLQHETVRRKPDFVKTEKAIKENHENLNYYRERYKDSILSKENLSKNEFSVNNLIQLADMYVLYMVLDHVYMEQNIPKAYATIHGHRRDPFFGNISKENFRRFLWDLWRNIWMFDDRYSTAFTRFLKNYYESL